MCETEKVESLGFFLASFLPRLSGKAPKLDQTSFVRMQFQAELCETFA